ncbi:hypothetical protein GCM10008018_50450 [Paenibacillus marchantiophytorum]|uniref:DUF1957 domain-containing protein n=1 Tax=Paenibacillus marchantiophytorum TaxID=1619310 RepID=A0ABQ1F3Z7_9BACL|nr:1,4-alpha-glucan branching protein domain-containing protein [Paenibacillus marchantiophytorum]GFZ98152.1 hypothetical protein GCM10008018_50450 [Paenibacillus marchantiophytorum]
MINRIKQKPELKGNLTLVWNAHLPFIRHQDQDDCLEECWFYEAMTETYLPLLEVMNHLHDDQIDFRLTFAMTPTLISLFSDPLMQERYRVYLQKQIQLAAAEQLRLANATALLPLARRCSERFRELQMMYESCQGDVVAAFKVFQDLGLIEIVTSAATHGYLPLMKTEEAIRAQIMTAVRTYEGHFGRKPRGFWLPECGYTPGIDRILKQAGVDYFFTDSSAVAFAAPQPNRELMAPLLTPYGVTAFPCDPESVSQVWSAKHAEDFLANRHKQAQHWLHWLDRKPIIVSSFDAELFGHCWYEGPAFLEQLCRKIHLDQHAIKMITPSEYLDEYPIADVGKLNESSWGRNHSAEMWLQGHNDWIYRHLHQAEERMIRLATKHEHLARHGKLSAQVLKRTLNQAARELMLAQSSDWAFIMDSQTDVDYAVRRTKDHLGNFHHLCDQIDRELVEEDHLTALEERNPIFADIRYQDYISIHKLSPIPIIPSLADWETLLAETSHRTNVFMLAWEYPPKQVGGLSRAVHELSEALAARGEIIHVITTSVQGAPAFEMMNGVYVHRLPIDHSGNTHFYHWAFEMNLAMIDHLVRWRENGGRIDLLHAHDWMVFHTAREIKASYGIPLIATIHATEWGRNQGNLYADLQNKIHQLEWKLTYEASRVFVCSAYMKEEVERIFHLPPDKVSVHPNGIETQVSLAPVHRPVIAGQQDKVIFYIGRLVYEKGIQILIAAMPAILSHVPQAKLVIAGSGPMEAELRANSAHLGDRVAFAGFVSDDYRTQLYQAAEVCVIPSLYEPFGIVALEAIAHKRPLILSDTGGLAEIIRHGVDGFKALPGHVDSLAWHVSEMLLQPQLALQMADSAYQLLQQHYQWAHIAEQIQDEYRRLTHGQLAIEAIAKH